MLARDQEERGLQGIRKNCGPDPGPLVWNKEASTFLGPMNTLLQLLELKVPYHWDRNSLWHQRKRPRLESLHSSASRLISLSLSFLICENKLDPSQLPENIVGTHSQDWLRNLEDAAPASCPRWRAGGSLLEEELLDSRAKRRGGDRVGGRTEFQVEGPTVLKFSCWEIQDLLYPGIYLAPRKTVI